MSGLTFIIPCPYCSKTFEWREGKVQDSIILHCESCGKELLTPDEPEAHEPLYKQCECGGYFEEKQRWNPYICPHCKNEIEMCDVRNITKVVEWGDSRDSEDETKLPSNS
ncbi:MAG: hypothetical protein IK117_03115 [Bacteroidales bacterium]|nr:hypothetical protein [Bacteroidales bacterium]